MLKPPLNYLLLQFDSAVDSVWASAFDTALGSVWALAFDMALDST